MTLGSYFIEPLHWAISLSTSKVITRSWKTNKLFAQLICLHACLGYSVETFSLWHSQRLHPKGSLFCLSPFRWAPFSVNKEFQFEFQILKPTCLFNETMSLDFKVRNILVSQVIPLVCSTNWFEGSRLDPFFWWGFSGIWNDVLLDRLPLDCKAADQFDRLYWTESQDSVLLTS